MIKNIKKQRNTLNKMYERYKQITLTPDPLRSVLRSQGQVENLPHIMDTKHRTRKKLNKRIYK